VVCGAHENRSFVVFSRLVCQIVTCQSLVEELVVFDFFAFVFGESGRKAFFRRLHSFGLVNVVLLQFVSLFLKKQINKSSLIYYPSRTFFFFGGALSQGISLSGSTLHSHTHACPFLLIVVMSYVCSSKKQPTMESVWFPKEYIRKLLHLQQPLSHQFSNCLLHSLLERIELCGHVFRPHSQNPRIEGPIETSRLVVSPVEHSLHYERIVFT
jgi:hypothetical protein